MNKYNLDKLIKVELNDIYPARWYTMKPEKRFFKVFVTQRAGIYQDFGPYLGMNVPENHLIKDGKIYEYPEVILHYENDFSKTYYFKTYDEAKKFADEITETGRWIS
jgi:hypothetical protein